MKRNRHCAETSSVCIFFFFLLSVHFSPVLLVFGCNCCREALGCFEACVSAVSLFQQSLFSYSVEIWHFVFFFAFALCFLVCLFYLSVCLQMHSMGLVFTCNAYFFIGAYFCFLWLAGHCLIGCDHRGNTFAMVFIQYSHFFLLFLPFFPVWEWVAYLCMREKLLLCAFCVSWVSNPISPAAVCCGQVFQESEAPWCSCLRLFFVLFCWRVFASFSPKFAFLSCSNALFPLLSLANDDEFARKSWTDDANINVADSNGSVVWISPHFLIYLFGSSVFVFICVCCHSVAFLSFFAWLGWQFVQEKIRCFSFVFLFSLVCLFVRIHPHPLSNMHM